MRLVILSVILLFSSGTVEGRHLICESFEPDSEELAVARAAGETVIPQNAKFDSACKFSSSHFEAPTSLEEYIQFNYNFIWPTRSLGDLQFFNLVTCIKGESPITCRASGSRVQIPNKKSIDYRERIDDLDVYGLVNFIESRFPEYSQITNFSKRNHVDPKPAHSQPESFKIEIKSATDTQRIVIEKVCESDKDCEFRLAPQTWIRRT